MSRTKSGFWDEINQMEDDDRGDAQAAIAEGHYRANKAADAVADLYGDEVHWFAQELAEDEDLADKVANAILTVLKDKHYQMLTGFTPATTGQTCGTHLQGKIINRSYDDLVKVFGHPQYRFDPADADGDNKIDVEWSFTFPDGRAFTIYNWKNGAAYCGAAGELVERMKVWHVGGHKPSVVWDLEDLLNIKLGLAEIS